MKNYFPINKSNLGRVIILLFILGFPGQSIAQNSAWIRPDKGTDPAIWGIRNGIVFGFWPNPIEPSREGSDGGPRGLIRVGYEYMGAVYLINFIAVEPVVNGKMEFSEISPSKVDGKWGKFMWATDSEKAGAFYPSAISKGVISHPDPQHPEIEELSLYVHMEQFMNGAFPYFKVTIRSDRPEEIGFQIFNREGSSQMERCALSATMGNYARIRELHLKNKIVDSRELYTGFDEIDFIEKSAYRADQLLKDKNGDLIALATSSESFPELSSWPQEQRYQARWGWRYRPFFKVTQYWRKEGLYDPSLQVRVNGRARYWSGGSQDKNAYVPIPGGLSFENFEMREKYQSGQKFYFGISRKTPDEILNTK
ncbi:MAG: hypothetical protein EOO88_18800 [Pedobacter sp.]|nr:MAG: hypothetical protein EOO88_18800 [Pedobacter sp.]